MKNKKQLGHGDFIKTSLKSHGIPPYFSGGNPVLGLSALRTHLIGSRLVVIKGSAGSSCGQWPSIELFMNYPDACHPGVFKRGPVICI